MDSEKYSEAEKQNVKKYNKNGENVTLKMTMLFTWKIFHFFITFLKSIFTM